MVESLYGRTGGKKILYLGTRTSRSDGFWHALDDFDRLCLENYIALLQLSYIDWKRQYYPSHPDIPLSDPIESNDNRGSSRSH